MFIFFRKTRTLHAKALFKEKEEKVKAYYFEELGDDTSDS